jgi:DNA-binding CsgD family transcriptional regulator
MLVPHLSRALGVMFRLRDAELKLAATRSALDRLASGVVLIGERRQVVFANRVARGLLAERDGLALIPGKGSDEHLVVDRRMADLPAALSSALDVDVAHFSAGIRVPRSHGRAPLVLNVSALPEANAFGGGPDVARAIVFVTDTGEPPQLNKALLQRIYALTDAELRVVAEVCAGGTLKDVAERLRVSEPTVRTQLQSAFTKTDTRRQAELVKLALSLSSTLT